MHDAGVGARPRAATDDRFEREVAALADAPTGADMTRRDFAILGLLGVVVPVLVLIWGWL